VSKAGQADGEMTARGCSAATHATLADVPPEPFAGAIFSSPTAAIP